MSLRTKLLLAMVLLPLLCLAVFLSLSVRAFVDDKVTFVYEWNQLQAQYLAAKIDFTLAQLKLNPTENLFYARTNKTFDKVVDVRGAVKKEQAFNVVHEYGPALCTNVRHFSWLYLEGRLLYAYCQPNGDDYDIYGLKKNVLADLFAGHGLSDTILAGQDGVILAGPAEYTVGRELKSILGTKVQEIFDTPTVPQGRLELLSQKDKINYLAHFYRIPNESMMIISLTPRSAPQRAAMLFVYKGVVFAAALLAIALFASLFISSAMLKNIFRLRKAMTDFGSGQLDAIIENPSKDEIGQLTVMFNNMVDQIGRLMKEREEKIKVDIEMNLASELQKRFFPSASYKSDAFQFAGFYEPANKCGGDWWTYTDTEDHFIVCIGDVTGHGLQSALITSAARAVVAEFKNNFLGPAKAMEVMNRAIYATSAGSLNMTCIIAAFDKKQGTITYTNASHEPTYYFTPKMDLKKSDINFLSEVHGPRLGESAEVKFEQTVVSCEPSLFLFYSDGLKDVMSPEGVAFEERRILRVLMKINDQAVSTDEVLSATQAQVTAWRQGADLIDDLSYFYVKN